MKLISGKLYKVKENSSTVFYMVDSMYEAEEVRTGSILMFAGIHKYEDDAFDSYYYFLGPNGRLVECLVPLRKKTQKIFQSFSLVSENKDKK